MAVSSGHSSHDEPPTECLSKCLSYSGLEPNTASHLSQYTFETPLLSPAGPNMPRLPRPAI